MGPQDMRERLKPVGIFYVAVGHCRHWQGGQNKKYHSLWGTGYMDINMDQFKKKNAAGLDSHTYTARHSE